MYDVDVYNGGDCDVVVTMHVDGVVVIAITYVVLVYALALMIVDVRVCCVCVDVGVLQWWCCGC